MTLVARARVAGVVRACALAVPVASLAGCFVVLDHELPAGELEELVALPRDFEGYTNWPSVVVGEAPGSAPHDATVRRVYLNAAPPDDAATFPVGTIIVKTGAGGELTGEAGSEVHAMVKRGGAFNAGGAAGWEWFELRPVGDDVVIVWRGAEPPAGESYGCLPGQDCDAASTTCNSCHAGSAGNDFVNSAALTLGHVDESLLGGSP